jgi:hypothetical protein
MPTEYNCTNSKNPAGKCFYNYCPEYEHWEDFSKRKDTCSSLKEV